MKLEKISLEILYNDVARELDWRRVLISNLAGAALAAGTPDEPPFQVYFKDIDLLAIISPKQLLIQIEKIDLTQYIHNLLDVTTKITSAIHWTSPKQMKLRMIGLTEYHGEYQMLNNLLKHRLYSNSPIYGAAIDIGVGFDVSSGSDRANVRIGPVSDRQLHEDNYFINEAKIFPPVNLLLDVTYISSHPKDQTEFIKEFFGKAFAFYEAKSVEIDNLLLL